MIDNFKERKKRSHTQRRIQPTKASRVEGKGGRASESGAVSSAPSRSSRGSSSVPTKSSRAGWRHWVDWVRLCVCGGGGVDGGR